MEISNKLKQLGLSQSEIKVYTWLLENGLSSPARIATGTGIARTNCYHLLKSLETQQLVTDQVQGKRKAYLARDPEVFLLSLERKKEIIDEIIPDLRALFVRQKNKPKIQFFDGWKETQSIYIETLSASKIIAIGSVDSLKKLDTVFFRRYQKEVAKRKIIFHDVLPGRSDNGRPQETDYGMGSLYEAKLLPSHHRKTSTDILIWNDSVALISLEEPIFGTVLTNASLAQALRTIFEVLWEKL